ncbi:MAG: hypothetical protein KJ558_12285 [Gammaproteobacteria bacterium]|nr:hypothetical protein [Gammaproteobacteria bacterium]MBU1655581.1 hypothetical protein [Gammaproteobacteria bacterium]MBU1960278.1 hypothetical protein [Gammaproteobacteria bacterium]
MAIRIKSHWHNEESTRSLEEVGGALAFNAWRIAKDKAINLHGKDFVYRTDAQRMAVIAEYLIFQVQVVDRMAHGVLDLDEASRRRLIVGFVKNIAGQMQDNSTDLFGPGDHGAAFIARLNERAGEYTGFNFDADGPSYPFYRHLGFEIQRIMGKEGENRWVIDQVMDRDGPDLARKMMRTVVELME